MSPFWIQSCHPYEHLVNSCSPILKARGRLYVHHVHLSLPMEVSVSILVKSPRHMSYMSSGSPLGFAGEGWEGVGIHSQFQKVASTTHMELTDYHFFMFA